MPVKVGLARIVTPNVSTCRGHLGAAVLYIWNIYFASFSVLLFFYLLPSLLSFASVCILFLPSHWTQVHSPQSVGMSSCEVLQIKSAVLQGFSPTTVSDGDGGDSLEAAWLVWFIRDNGFSGETVWMLSDWRLCLRSRSMDSFEVVWNNELLRLLFLYLSRKLSPIFHNHHSLFLAHSPLLCLFILCLPTTQLFHKPVLNPDCVHELIQREEKAIFLSVW